MANNPQNRKLSHQFGDITGPSESELTDIETQGEDSWYTPERIDAMREHYAKIDPNYAAVRSARQGIRGGGVIPTSSAIGRNGLGSEEMRISSKSNNASAIDQTRTEGVEFGVDTSVDMGNSGDAAGAHYAISGAGMGGWDSDTRKRASSFDRLDARPGESMARAQGETYLKVAGPTCNHPRCMSFRARGMELLGRYLGTDRAGLDEKTFAKAVYPERAIPSVRKDVRVAPAVLRPESENVPVGQRVGKFGLHDVSTKQQRSDDLGDFTMAYGKEEMVPKYTAVDSKHPDYVALMNNWKTRKEGDKELFHPDDYLEHHHGPDDAFAPLPWEA